MSSLQQAKTALGVANVVRFEHSRIRQEIASLDREAGRARAAEVIRNPEGELSTLRAAMLLKSCRSMGEVTIRRLLAKAEVGAHVRLGTIPPGKREALARLVEQ